MNNSNFSEWTREQKEQFAERRMLEMKLKNEKLLRRYAEVENDRIEAENRNSAVTNTSKVQKKEKDLCSYVIEKARCETEKTREWDRGKLEKDNWMSPNHHGSFKDYRSGRYERKDIEKKDSWGTHGGYRDDSWNDHTSAGLHERKGFERRGTWSGYPRNENSHYRSDRTSDSSQSRKMKDNYRYQQRNDQHNTFHPHLSPKQTKPFMYKINESNRKSQLSYCDEKNKKVDFNQTNLRKKHSLSRSPSKSDPDYTDNGKSSIGPSKIETSLWENDKVNEDQSRQNRIAKWVKTVSQTKMYAAKQVSLEQKDKPKKFYSKFDRTEHSADKSSHDDDSPNFKTSLETKSKESSLIFPRSDFYEDKSKMQDSFTSYVASNSVRQTDGVKMGYKNHSSHYNLANNDRDENFRKQRRFDNRGFKHDDGKGKFGKFKMLSSTVCEGNTGSNLGGRSKEIQQEKSISIYKNANLDDVKEWHKADEWGVKESDDGLWGSAEQSDIKWNLSDEETDFKNENSNFVSVTKNVLRSAINENRFSSTEKNADTKQKGIGNCETKNESKSQDCDGVWGDVAVAHSVVKQKVPDIRKDLSDIPNNVESAKTNKIQMKHNDQQCKSDMRDGFKVLQPAINENKDNCHGRYKKKNENYRNNEEIKPVDGIWADVRQSDIKWEMSENELNTNDDKERCNNKECASGHTNDVHKSDLHKDCKVDEWVKSDKEKNTGGSDDGGWSTVSEGETH